MVTPQELLSVLSPNGHEFTSFYYFAILNLDGKGKNFPDEAVCNRVKALKGPMHLVTLRLTDLYELS